MNAETKNIIDAALDQFAKDGLTTIRELKGISDKQMNAMYAVGFNLFNSGRLEDAEKIFKGLLLLDHLERKYWFGYAAIKQQQKNFAEALKAYQVAAVLDNTNPKTVYQIAECHLALGDKLSAEEALGIMFENCDFSGETGSKYRAKAETLKKVIENMK